MRVTSWLVCGLLLGPILASPLTAQTTAPSSPTTGAPPTPRPTGSQTLDAPTDKDKIPVGYTAGKNETISLPNRVTLDLIWIPSGHFTMGSGDLLAGDRGPQTQVTITKGFWIGRTLVTQAQYQAVTGGNPSRFKGETLPAEQVSWDDAMAFCQKLAKVDPLAVHLPPTYGFTLPTEAQWEYACRAGTTGDGHDEMNALSWNSQNSEGTTHPVGLKQANAWGLYDMHGNVWEWCFDWYGKYPGGEESNPTGPATGTGRVDRGGSWFSGPVHCSSTHRGFDAPGVRFSNVGFRLALAPSP